jgi:hypothetical protein
MTHPGVIELCKGSESAALQAEGEKALTYKVAVVDERKGAVP